MGNAFGRAVLAGHARTFPTQVNQFSLYTQVYADLQVALQKLNTSVQQFGFPAPEAAQKYSAERLLGLNRQAGEVINQYRESIASIRFLLDPANAEMGAGDQLDRTQKGACESSAVGGIYGNFDWPLKTLTTTVKDQGRRSTCWAFATIAALEAEIARRDRKLVNLSEQDYAGHRFLEWSPRAFGEGGDPLFIAQKASASNYTFAYESGWQYNKSQSRVERRTAQTYTQSCDGYRDASANLGACSDTTDQGHWTGVVVDGKVYLARSLPNTGAGSGYRMQSPTDFWNQDDRDTSMTVLLLRSVLGHPTTLTLDARYLKPTANAAPAMSNMTPDANGFVPAQTMKNRADGAPDWELNHVVTVTGFISSQNIRRVLSKQAVADDFGYFIVKNSWGDC